MTKKRIEDPFQVNYQQIENFKIDGSMVRAVAFSFFGGCFPLVCYSFCNLYEYFNRAAWKIDDNNKPVFQYF